MHASRIIQGLLRTQCPFIHAKRRDCLARVAAAASGGLGVVKLGKALGGPTGLRHRIKCCDRLLSNPHLAHERIAIYQAMAHRLLSRLQQVCIVVDWSELREAVLALADFRIAVDVIGPSKRGAGLAGQDRRRTAPARRDA